MGKNAEICIKKSINLYEEKKLIELRKEVNKLYFQYDLKKTQIMEKEGVSKPFVIKWTKFPGQDFERDTRGWEKGKNRIYTSMIDEKILTLHKQLTEDTKNYFTGSTAIHQEWLRQYPEDQVPSIRTIGRVRKRLGLTQTRKGRSKGAAAYLCYPEHTIYNELAGRVLEADFIGRKYIKERTEPINFIGFSFKKAPKLRYYKRIDAQNSKCFIEQCKVFFDKFEKPDYIKVDNGLAFIGSASGKRNISSTMFFLLENQVIPIFSVPRKPFTQASIEGNNSVFSRFFWNKTEFKSLDQVDEQLEWFNKSSLKYTEYKKPNSNKSVKENFIPKVLFIRQVKQGKKDGYIDVLNENISIDKSLINYYILAEWNLKNQNLNIYFEKENQSKLISIFSFKINEYSLKKINQKGKRLFGT